MLGRSVFLSGGGEGRLLLVFQVCSLGESLEGGDNGYLE